jgi:putative DNA primase/helicase
LSGFSETSFEVDLEDSPLADPSQYFDERGKFNPTSFAKDVWEYLNIITITETQEILHWDEGCYRGGMEGESAIRRYLPVWLGKYYERVSLSAVNDFIMRLRAYSSRDQALFDSDPQLLPLKNGVLDIDTLEFEDYRKDKHHFLFQLSAKYDPEATCPKFAEFVSEIVYPADVPVIQEIFGYCLWREGIESIKKALMFLGGGNNGKSLLCTVLKEMLGADNVSGASLISLGERFGSAQLRGKLANICADLPDQALKQTGRFKELVGDDLINAEIKHGGFFRFINKAKPIFSANKLPEANDDSDAYYDRWQMVNFPYKFVTGKKKLGQYERPAKNKNKLKAELLEELPGILNWSLHGLKRLRENDCFSNMMDTEQIRDFYLKNSNSCAAFVLEECILTGKTEDFISKEDFFQRYHSFCELRKLSPMTKERIGRNLPSWFAGKVESGRDFVGKDRLTTWRDIRFKNEEEKAGDQQTLDGETE